MHNKSINVLKNVKLTQNVPESAAKFTVIILKKPIIAMNFITALINAIIAIVKNVPCRYSWSIKTIVVVKKDVPINASYAKSPALLTSMIMIDMQKL